MGKKPNDVPAGGNNVTATSTVAAVIGTQVVLTDVEQSELRALEKMALEAKAALGDAQLRVMLEEQKRTSAAQAAAVAVNNFTARVQAVAKDHGIPEGEAGRWDLNMRVTPLTLACIR